MLVTASLNQYSFADGSHPIGYALRPCYHGTAYEKLLVEAHGGKTMTFENRDAEQVKRDPTENVDNAALLKEVATQNLMSAFYANERLEDKSEKGAAETPQRIEAAKRFDEQLKTFADPTDGTVYSKSLTQMQDIVRKFNNSADKSAAVEEAAPAYMRLHTATGKEMMEGTIKELDELQKQELKKDPNRMDLQNDKAIKFFGALEASPPLLQGQVNDALERRRGESQEQRDKRVDAVIANNPALKTAFEELKEARSITDAKKTPRERELEAKQISEYDDMKLLQAIWRTVVLRSYIKA